MIEALSTSVEGLYVVENEPHQNKQDKLAVHYYTIKGFLLWMEPIIEEA